MNRALRGKVRDAGVLNYISYGGPPAKADYVRATADAGKALHWRLYREVGSFVRSPQALCGRLIHSPIYWWQGLKKYRAKDVCKKCDAALAEIRAAEAKAHAENFDEEGEPRKKPTPKERATAVKARALARPKKAWQPKNKQRSFRVERTHRKPKAKELT